MSNKKVSRYGYFLQRVQSHSASIFSEATKATFLFYRIFHIDVNFVIYSRGCALTFIFSISGMPATSWSSPTTTCSSSKQPLKWRLFCFPATVFESTGTCTPSTMTSSWTVWSNLLSLKSNWSYPWIPWEYLVLNSIKCFDFPTINYILPFPVSICHCRLKWVS